MRLSSRLLLFVLIVLLASASVPPLPTRAAPPGSAIRWAYYVGYDPAGLVSLRANVGKLDVVSPGYYRMDAAGRIGGSEDPEVSAIVRQSGAKLIPIIVNTPRYADFSPVLMQPEIRAQAVRSVVDLVQSRGFDGINIDFEGLSAEDRPGLTHFMAELANELRPKGKLVTMAVPDKRTDTTTGWAGAYDYARLGPHVDYLIIMTYAHKTSHSPTPGSYSPYSLVDQAAAFAASQVPASKVLFGIGTWGYDWNLTTPGRATVLNHTQVMELARTHSGTLGYDENHQSAWLRYQAGGAQREVWFENKRSVAAKMDIATRRGLGGVAFWRLGFEDPGVWDLVEYTGPIEFAIPGGRFFTQTGGGGGRGYRVVDEGRDTSGNPIRFWSEFVRLGGVQTLGYPVSHRYTGSDGFAYQAFQRGVLQWRPELGVAFLANTFEQLTEANRDSELDVLGIPQPILDDGSRGDWMRARSIRLGWLTEPSIRSVFWANPNPSAIARWDEDLAIQLYGLPASQPQRLGPFIVQRFQRVSLQLWIEDVPGMPPRGSVVGILGGDMLKSYGLIPADAARAEVP